MSIVEGGLSRGVSNQAERADPLKEGGRQGFAREGMLAADSPFIRKRRSVSVAVLCVSRVSGRGRVLGQGPVARAADSKGGGMPSRVYRSEGRRVRRGTENVDARNTNNEVPTSGAEIR